MTAPYIPPRDAQLDQWGANFSSLITAAPATYGLLTSDATAIQTAFNNWHAAYLLTATPATRTQANVAAKNSEKAAATSLWRTYAQIIRNNPGVADADKLALGLNLPNNTPSPIPGPTSQPLIAFKAATPLQHELRYTDFNSPGSRKKAPGTIALQLVGQVYAATDPTPTDPTAAPLLGNFTKNPAVINFTSGQAGKTIRYWARWVNRNGLAGPWSDAVQQMILPA